MRRDICHFFPADVATVYNGYLSALGNNQFGRDCREEPFHTLSFGLNFSMKYNMNGGACIVRFIPYQNGTAVNLRFTVAQIAGARYGAYDNDLTLAVEKVLGIVVQPLKLDVDEFLKPQNKVVAAPEPMYQAPQPASQPVQQPTYSYSAQPPVQNYNNQSAPAKEETLPQNGTCFNCGAVVREGSDFCVNCGVRLTPEIKVCPNCGKQADITDKFCSGCGYKL